jgi:hypothetical protein
MESERNRNSGEERSLRYLREYSIVLTQKRKLDRSNGVAKAQLVSV